MLIGVARLLRLPIGERQMEQAMGLLAVTEDGVCSGERPKGEEHGVTSLLSLTATWGESGKRRARGDCAFTES